MTLYLWIMVGVIIAKFALLIPLIRSIRESHATIRRCNQVLKAEDTP